MSERRDGYNRLSIFIHWLTAILVIALFVTHEGKPGDPAYLIHVGGGAIVGLFLLWRVWRRISRGQTAKSDQATIFNIASDVVMWGFLASIVVVTVTGYLLPWSKGEPLDIFGLLAIPTPMAANLAFHGVMEEAHEVAGHLMPILFLLHVAGAVKHLVINRDGVVARMLKPVQGGR